MSTRLQQLQNALRQADAAGNTEDANRLAAAIRAEMAAQEGPVDFDAGTMVENIIPSAKQYGKDIWNAVTSPIETGKAVGGVIGGGLEQMGRKFEEFLHADSPRELAKIEYDPEEEAMFDAMKQVMVDRYGSVDKAKETLMHDPVGVFADVATVVAPVAGAPGKVGQVAKVAQMADLGNLTTKGVRTLGKLTPEGAAPWLYGKAAKINPSRKNRDRIIDTLIRERIKPTKRGQRKFDALLKETETSLNRIVDEATESGQLIPREKIYQHVDALFDDLGGIKAEGLRDQGKVVDVVGEVMDNISERKMLTPREVQDFKVDLYNKIYKRKISPEATKREGVKTQTQEHLARGARHGLEDVTGGDVAPINQLLGDLYTSQGALGQSVNRISNTNILPARTLFGGAAGGWKGALVAALVDHPSLKAKLAFAIDALKKGDIMQAERGLTSNEIRTAMRLAEMTEDELREMGFD